MTAPRIPWPDGKRLRHVKQRLTGSRTSSTDCGPSADVMVLEAATGLRPPREDFKEWIAALRSEMSRGPGWPATRLLDQRVAFIGDLVRGLFLAGGRKRSQSAVLRATHAQVIRWLDDGRPMVLAIDYGRLNDLMPSLSGSRRFRGGHSVMLGGLVRRNGVAWTRLGDPLHDGFGGAPHGWQTVRVRRYLRAAETFGSPKAGKGKAYVLWMAKGDDL